MRRFSVSKSRLLFLLAWDAAFLRATSAIHSLITTGLFLVQANTSQTSSKRVMILFVHLLIRTFIFHAIFFIQSHEMTANVVNKKKQKSKLQKEAPLNAIVFEENLNYQAMLYLYHKNLRITIDVSYSEFEYLILLILGFPRVGDQRMHGLTDTVSHRYARPHIQR